MTEINISLDDFKSLLADLFGQPLKQEAEVATRDFWQNISAITDGVSQGSISIYPDFLFLSRDFPEYKKHYVWKGLAILIFLISLPVFIFSWGIAIFILALSVICHITGNLQRKVSGQKFVSGIKTSIIARDLSKGVGKLCAHYIAGHVLLVSNIGRAHWPRLPSDVLTGKQDFQFKRSPAKRNML
ncbi:MAG: hypothetical protein JRC93_07500 [Deltaproteobacteria bacterium]|nr:hypothetical protein [Deltaproteobacteria bacterium]